MKERPILFSGEMVRAILAGRKTQARMVVEPQPSWNSLREQWDFKNSKAAISWSGKTPLACALIGMRDICPYGKTGDRLLVRASRITLEMESVMVQRVQDISHEDAIAEGVEANYDDGVPYYGPFGKGHCDPRIAFSWLWDLTYAQLGYPWAENPFAWAVTFRRVL